MNGRHKLHKSRIFLFEKLTHDFTISLCRFDSTMISVEAFRQMALSLPGAAEKPHFDRASFRANKIFATLDERNNRACLMLSEEDQSVFCSHDPSVIYPVPNKWGKHGATYVELSKVRKDLLKDALHQAYQKAVLRSKPKKDQ